MKPPFVPRVRDELDTSNIDPAFTREMPTVTPTPVDAVLGIYIYIGIANSFQFYSFLIRVEF